MLKKSIFIQNNNICFYCTTPTKFVLTLDTVVSEHLSYIVHIYMELSPECCVFNRKIDNMCVN
jgi:hypothetical protein